MTAAALSSTAPEAPVPSTEPQVVVSTPVTDENAKTDEITAIQDSIDGLSLAMFEALRGLRDAVAPSSTEVSDTGPDFEEFWQSYRDNNPETVLAVRRLGGPPHSSQDFVRIFIKFEAEKDKELVARLAQTVLEKSQDVKDRVTCLQGMDRTRTQQLELISDLITEHAAVEQELQQVHELARQRRQTVRKVLQEETCKALGIEEFKY